MPAEHSVRRGGSRRVSLGLPAPLACGGWGWAAGGREGERRRCVAERCLLREHAEACLFVRARSPQGPAPGGLGLRRGSGSSRLAVGRVSREPEEELLFGVRGFKIFGGWGGVFAFHLVQKLLLAQGVEGALFESRPGPSPSGNRTLVSSYSLKTVWRLSRARWSTGPGP